MEGSLGGGGALEGGVAGGRHCCRHKNASFAGLYHPTPLHINRKIRLERCVYVCVCARARGEGGVLNLGSRGRGPVGNWVIGLVETGVLSDFELDLAGFV